MDFIELVKKRYSCRSFSEKQVEKEKIDLILEAGRLNIPIIIVAKVGSKISSTVLGSGKIKATLFYNDKDDIKKNLNGILKI